MLSAFHQRLAPNVVISSLEAHPARSRTIEGATERIIILRLRTRGAPGPTWSYRRRSLEGTSGTTAASAAFGLASSHDNGRLAHKPGGSGGATWVFDYDERRLDDDEAGYRFGAHSFVPGEYVTVRDQDNSHTFRVVAVENA